MNRERLQIDSINLKIEQITYNFSKISAMKITQDFKNCPLKRLMGAIYV